MATFTHVTVLLGLTQLTALAATEHVVYNAKTLEGSETCPGDQQIRAVLDEIDVEVRGVFRDSILPIIPVGSRQSRPASSCSEIAELYPGMLSGYYWILSRSGTAVQLYCDMNRVCGCAAPEVVWRSQTERDSARVWSEAYPQFCTPGIHLAVTLLREYICYFVNTFVTP